MAIENLDSEEIIQQEVKTQTSTLVPIERVFSNSNIWLAGMLKVRSPLIDESMTLYGFIGNYRDINIDDFKVNGMNIRFADENGNYTLRGKYKIYPKVIADLKKSAFYELFPMMKSISLTDTFVKSGIGFTALSKDYQGLVSRANYYFFDSNIHNEPSVASFDVFLVCKYIIEGKTKYAIFAPHEVMLENQ